MIRTDLIAPIGVLIGRQAKERPAAVAFVDKTRAVSYGALSERTARLAAYLQTCGVQPGQSVALFLPHGVNWVEACFAILRANAVVVPISTDSTDSEIAYRLADAFRQRGPGGPAGRKAGDDPVRVRRWGRFRIDRDRSVAATSA